MNAFPEMPVLADRFGRRFPYLRLSVTDVCNFRCTYCLPDGYRGPGMKGVLSVDEIRRLLAGFSLLGLKKVRITGGEPTLRPDILRIVETAAATPGVEMVAMTTNGYRLPHRVADFAAAGVTALNVSIDSLDRETFARVTGHDRLDEVLAGLEVAAAAGIGKLKLNAVLLKDINDGALDSFLDFVRDRPIDVRFIEMMETGDMTRTFARHHVSADGLIAHLLDRGWAEAPRGPLDGPARAFAHPDHRGRIGVIAPYAKSFCATCNRLRVSSKGALQLCLFAAGGHDLRPLLQDDGQAAVLAENIRSVMGLKTETHGLHAHDPGATRNLSQIGG